MATDNLKDFALQGVVGGLLLVCLLSFAIAFMYTNNPTGLGDTGTQINSVYENSSNFLIESPESADILLNITSNTNPEVSQLGSRDVVSTSYSAYGSPKQSFESAKLLISWVFTETRGKLLLGVLGGIIGLLGYFYIVKHIKQGI
jgi:hypothetical protein